MAQQLALFDSDGADVSVDDLHGLLLGRGHVVRRGSRARVSVLVDEIWRAEALASEMGRRDLDGSYELSRDDSSKLVVRTALTDELGELADRWQPGRPASTGPRLTSGGLRLWAISGGRRVESGYLLPLTRTDETRWPRSGRALEGIGLRVTLVGPRGGGPAYRVTSARALRLLATLVGTRPDGAPDYLWP